MSTDVYHDAAHHGQLVAQSYQVKKVFAFLCTRFFFFVEQLLLWMSLPTIRSQTLKRDKLFRMCINFVVEKKSFLLVGAERFTLDWSWCGNSEYCLVHIYEWMTSAWILPSCASVFDVLFAFYFYFLFFTFKNHAPQGLMKCWFNNTIGWCKKGNFFHSLYNCMAKSAF